MNKCKIKENKKILRKENKTNVKTRQWVNEK